MGGMVKRRRSCLLLGIGALLAGCQRNASEVQAGETAGFITPPSSTPSASPNSSGTDANAKNLAAPAVSAAKPANSSPPAAQPPKAPSAGAPPPASAKTPSNPAEVELASALLHLPAAEFEKVLAAKGSALSETRRRMYRAFAAGLAGDTERAKGFANGLDGSDEVSATERAGLKLAVGAPESGGQTLPAGMGSDSVASRALSIGWRAREASSALGAARWADAARGYSDVLLGEIGSPWTADRAALARWNEGLNRAQANHRWSARGTWPSIQVTVKGGDNLTLIRKRVLAEHPQMLVCTGLIEKANHLANEKDLHPGNVLRVPTDRARMLVDISSRWAFYLLGDEVAAAWECGVGKPGSETRPGNFVIGLKRTEPMWFPKGKAPVPYGDPANPLGTRWLSWVENDLDTGLGFHGTNEPDGVGGAVSAGCVRMRNQDVELLYEILPVGAAVTVQE
jgi:L,D-transpeptidase ErfK/SrfK